MHRFLAQINYFSFIILITVSSVTASPDTKINKEVNAANHDPLIDKRETQGLSIDLVSEVTSITPDKPFYVGLKIEHDPGFHTYWKNPGVVGMPTQIRWTLPDGFEASEIQWPYPETSKMADYPCFGYERDVLLLVKITPPKKATSTHATLTANANWMCCSSNCFPGFKKFSLTLPITEELDKPHINEDLLEKFQQSKASIPQATDKITAKLLSPAGSQEIKVQITCAEGITPKYIFNSDGQTTPDLYFKLTKTSETTWLYEAERSEFGAPSSATFPFILKTQTNYYQVVAK